MILRHKTFSYILDGFIYHVQQHKAAGCKQLAGGSVPQAAPHNCKYPGELLVPPVQAPGHRCAFQVVAPGASTAAAAAAAMHVHVDVHVNVKTTSNQAAHNVNDRLKKYLLPTTVNNILYNMHPHIYIGHWSCPLTSPAVTFLPSRMLA